MVLGQVTYSDPKTKVFITFLFIQVQGRVSVKIPEEEEECHVVETPSYLYHILQGTTRARHAHSSLSNKASGR